MSDETLKEKASELDAEEICKYCKYEDECLRGIRCYGGEPIFPYCAEHDMEEYFNYESFLEDLED